MGKKKNIVVIKGVRERVVGLEVILCTKFLQKYCEMFQKMIDGIYFCEVPGNPQTNGFSE